MEHHHIEDRVEEIEETQIMDVTNDTDWSANIFPEIEDNNNNYQEEVIVIIFHPDIEEICAEMIMREDEEA